MDSSDMAEGARLGVEAEALLNGEIFNIAKVSASGEILEKLYSVDVASNEAGALELIRSLQSMNRFIEQIEDIISDGKFLQEQIKQLEN